MFFFHWKCAWAMYSSENESVIARATRILRTQAVSQENTSISHFLHSQRACIVYTLICIRTYSNIHAFDFLNLFSHFTHVQCMIHNKTLAARSAHKSKIKIISLSQFVRFTFEKEWIKLEAQDRTNKNQIIRKEEKRNECSENVACTGNISCFLWYLDIEESMILWYEGYKNIQA